MISACLSNVGKFIVTSLGEHLELGNFCGSPGVVLSSPYSLNLIIMRPYSNITWLSCNLISYCVEIPLRMYSLSVPPQKFIFFINFNEDFWLGFTSKQLENLYIYIYFAELRHRYPLYKCYQQCFTSHHHLRRLIYSCFVL